jgi:hypothetical protein
MMMLVSWSVIAVVLLRQRKRRIEYLEYIHKEQQIARAILASMIPTAPFPSIKDPIPIPLSGLIVEPRVHRYLIKVIENFQHVLPGVPIQVMGSKASLNHIHTHLLNMENVHLHDLQVENLKIKDYSLLCAQPELYELCMGDHILFFQTDSILFSNTSVKVE